METKDRVKHWRNPSDTVRQWICAFIKRMVSRKRIQKVRERPYEKGDEKGIGRTREILESNFNEEFL